MRTVRERWAKIGRAARRFSGASPLGIHPAIRWFGLLVLLVYAAVLLYGLVPRSDEIAASIFFWGTVAGFVIFRFVLKWKGDPKPLPIPENQAHRQFLRDRVVILASLVARGLAEYGVQSDLVKPEVSAKARQLQNGLLRDRSLWNQLESGERTLMASTQGAWTEDQTKSIFVWVEQLRLLRYVLRIDRDLVALEDGPQPDWDAAFQTSEATDFGGTESMLASWDVRVERDKAQLYTVRVLAELAHRGMLLDGESSMLQFRNTMAGTSHELRLASTKVEDLDNDTLQSIAFIAHTRWEYASYLVDLLASDRIDSFDEWVVATAGSDNGE